ncbi:MAG TPA: DUF1361 domain-containing protein [Chthoniobacteraceae bacterium]|nr:DUF1361 domain-containing protein [Chthoniobacteraceae bacterium]
MSEDPLVRKPKPILAPVERVIAHDRRRHSLYTLLFGTGVCAGMLLVRFVCAGNLRFSGLFGNLLLAWIPLVLALVIRQMPGGNRRFWFWTATLLWILFFPNAFYLVTDLIHMKKFGTDGIFRWFDMLMTTGFACGGIFLGCLSLYLMHLLVRQRFGWRIGWLFAGGMLALGSFGIYLGRFLRLNSWDVITRPFKLAGNVSSLIKPQSSTEVIAFSLTFFFSLAAYCFVVSVARLHEAPIQKAPEAH